MNNNRSKYLWYTLLGRLCVWGQCANGALHGRACTGNPLVRSWNEYCSSLKDLRSFASVARTFVYAPGIGKHNWLSSAVPNVENCKGSTCPCARNQCCFVCSAAVLVATSTRLANSHRTIVLYKGLSSALRKNIRAASMICTRNFALLFSPMAKAHAPRLLHGRHKGLSDFGGRLACTRSSTLLLFSPRR